MQSFAIIGGDQRQARLARLLLQDGHEVYTWALPLQATQTTDSLEDTAARGHCVIWPVPMITKDGFLNVAGTSLDSSYALTNLRSDQVAVGGRVSASLLQQAEESGLILVDYTSREDFAIANAVPTAEGAIQLAMEQTESTLHGSQCLIIGFGRIGKVLARLLSALGVKVTVSARRVDDFLWCDVQGYQHLETRTLGNNLGAFDMVFNTVPHLVLGDDRLKAFKPGCLLIDLASVPGGVDFAAAKRRGLNCHWALSLPGKVAPESAAEILRDTIYQIIKERSL